MCLSTTIGRNLTYFLVLRNNVKVGANRPKFEYVRLQFDVKPPNEFFHIKSSWKRFMFSKSKQKSKIQLEYIILMK